jgi:hypothetical protein
MSDTTPSTKNTSNRKTIIGLLVLFAMPIALAYFGWAMGWFRDVGVAAYGRLLNPVVAGDQYTVTTDTTWTPSWYLVVAIEGEDCGELCLLNEDLARRVRLALGKDADRVRLLWLHTRKPVRDEETRSPVETLGTLETPAPLQGQRIYIMDPHGNIMLEYDWASSIDKAPLHGKGILRDLKKLLKFSHIG